MAQSLLDIVGQLNASPAWIVQTLRERGFTLQNELLLSKPSAMLNDDMIDVLDQHVLYGHIPTGSKMNTNNGIIERAISVLNVPDEQRASFRSILEQALPAVIEEVKTQFGRDTLDALSESLDILYEQERKHLDLIKEYKEEIKFAHTMQEDLRRERAGFFAQTLKEVSATLQEAPVDKSVAANWVQELVRSYTASLDVSNDVIQTTALDRLGSLSEKSNLIKAKVERKSNIDADS